MKLSEAIIVAIITGGLALIGTIIATHSSSANTKKEITHKLETSQAVTDAILKNLAEEVRKHNNFAEKIPVLEEKIKTANHRIDDLESAAKAKE